MNADQIATLRRTAALAAVIAVGAASPVCSAEPLVVHSLPQAPTVTMTVEELVAMQQRAPAPRGPTVRLPLAGSPQIVPPKPAPLPVEVANYGAVPRPVSPEAAAVAASVSTGLASGSVAVVEAIGEVGFSSHSATLDPTAQAQVTALAGQLNRRLGSMPSARVRVAPRYQIGAEKDRMVEQRGDALKRALVAAGIPASRIEVDTDVTGRRDAGGRRTRVELLMLR